jgi:hypothetical protein
MLAAMKHCVLCLLLVLAAEGWPDLVLAAAQPPIKAAPTPKPAVEWIYLDNGQVRLGLKKSSGAAIGYFSPSGSTNNLLNHYDHGRLVQQSYYGSKDDSLWNQKPWRWNPVQGGDWRGHPARVLEMKVSRTTAYARTMPKHWASGADLPEVAFEQWVALTGKVATVRYRMTYAGTNTHPAMDHEIPAFFVEPRLENLVLYDGDAPWTGAPVSRSKPGWPNESRKMTENWAAYVDARDFGVGAYVPMATRLTCYRYRGGGSSNCSYFAPLTRFAITPEMVFAYDLYLALGTSEEIRATFKSIHDASPK